MIGRPHGVKGEVKVFLHNPSSENLTQLSHVYIGNGNDRVRYAIDSIRPGSGCLRLALNGVTTREQADGLKGQKICTERDTLAGLAEDEFYVVDLLGLDVWEGETHLGRVLSSREQGGIEVITVSASGEELQIPLVEEYVVAIEIHAGRILIRNSAQLRLSDAHGENEQC